jgi:DNA-binding SARP family transcriptional activator/TolB-like protein
MKGPLVQPRQIALLALLAMAGGKPISREKLIATMWPESSPKRARHSLREAMYVINKAFASTPVEAISDGLRLDPDRLRSDVWTFLSCVESGDLAAAVDTYRGPFLDGFYLAGSLEFEEWARVTRDQLARAYKKVLETLSDTAMGAGDYEQALRWSQELLSVDPYSGASTVRLMEALTELGEGAEALREADVHAVRMQKMFDADPDPKVTEMKAALLESGISEQASHERPRVVESVGPATSSLWWRSKRVVAGLLVLGLLISFGVYQVTRSPGPAEVRGTDPEAGMASLAVAVMPFDVHGEDEELWSEGMLDLLVLGLGNVEGVRTLTSRTVLAAWQREVGPDDPVDLATRLEVARSIGGRYAVVGGVVALGPRVRFTVDVYEVASGKHLGRSQVDSVADSVLMVADRLTVGVLRLVYRGQGDLPEVNLAQITSADPEAIKAYLLGMVRFRHGDFAEAVEAYERAIEADSTFAEAHYELSILRAMWDYRVLNFTLSQYHRDQALRFSDRVSVRTHIFAQAQRDWFEGTLDGFEPLREWVRLHPDDSRAWSHLANSYRNLPGTLAGVEEMQEAWTKALGLDSLDLLPLAYLMELTWEVLADSAPSVELAERFNRLAPAQVAEYGAWFETFLALAFGDSTTRERTIAGLDTIVSPKTQQLPHELLAHPRWAELTEEVLLAFEHNGVETVLGPTDGMALFHLNANWRGKVRRGLTYLEGYDRGKWELPAPDVASFVWDLAYLPGLPMAKTYEQLFGSIDIENIERNGMVYYAGIYAANQGRWNDHARAVDEMRRRIQRTLNEGDSLSARLVAASVGVMEAYAKWRRGDPTAAVAAIEDALQFRALSVRWILGELYMELERWDDAARVYNSLGFDYRRRLGVWPLSHYKLGIIYENLEEPEEAIASYEYFVENWKDADPELQPMVEEARQAMIRVKDLQRE